MAVNAIYLNAGSFVTGMIAGIVNILVISECGMDIRLWHCADRKNNQQHYRNQLPYLK